MMKASSRFRLRSRGFIIGKMHEIFADRLLGLRDHLVISIACPFVFLTCQWKMPFILRTLPLLYLWTLWYIYQNSVGPPLLIISRIGHDHFSDLRLDKLIKEPISQVDGVLFQPIGDIDCLLNCEIGRLPYHPIHYSLIYLMRKDNMSEDVLRKCFGGLC